MEIKTLKIELEKLKTKLNLIINATTPANKKLANGPNKDTIAISLLGFFKLYGFTGTGLAQPKTIGLELVIFANITIITGTKIVPIISICFKGFKLNLPYCSAVLSPNILAACP